MQTALKHLNPISQSVLSAIESRWQKALPFFKKRGQVIFISDRYRFWDNPGFVQQSLAKTLVDYGIKVTWLDGMDWRTRKNVVPFSSPLLKVTSLKCLPGRRFSICDALSIEWQANQIKKLQAAGNPLTWVQGSLDERISSKIESIDVFSVFDDAFYHAPESTLARKSKLILSQNAFTDDRYRAHYPQKAYLALPPVELNSHVFQVESPRKLVPDHFPRKIMGYLGAFFPEGFDFNLLEKCVRELPDWGFLMVGRTNQEGSDKIKHLKTFSNFHHREWIPKERISSFWQLLDVNLMFYRESRANSGAYPIKVLESMYFGVPSVATRCSKTSSLEGIIPLSSNPQELIYLAKAEAMMKKDQSRVFESLFYEMHPKVHLARVAEALSEG
ncbi:MAG: glycosyltransferase [Pseudomonadota bacterium]